jgi:polar amino acid transport system substrate-binding protein
MARREDARIRGLNSLRGLRVGTLANSAAWHLLVSRGALPQPYDGSVEVYDDLEAGRIDAVLLDDIVAMRYGQTRPALRVVDDVQDGYYAIGVPRGDDELRTELDAALTRIARSGELRRILDHWNIDSERQQRLVHWTDAQTRELLSNSSSQRFAWLHVWLFLKAAIVTLVVSIASMVLAIPLGMGLALARLYGPRIVGATAATYVELFRGTPVLLQLYVLYFGLGKIIQLDAFTAAVLGLGLNYGAYEAEVYRAGIQAVPKGQMEAAVSLGMSTSLALRRIVMPQAFRLALPSVTNDFIALLKDSSLVSVITVVELTKRTNIAAENTGSWLIPGLLCAALYFAMGYPLSRLARRLEARLARS